MRRLGRYGARVKAGVNSVRGRLVLLTLSLLIPALLSMGFLLSSADRQGRTQLNEQMLTTARALSGAIDRQAAVGIAVAETLATDQALLAGDWARFHARALRVTDRRVGWVVVADMTGQQILNTRTAYGVVLPRSPRIPELDRALLVGRSQVSDLRMGLVAKQYAIAVGTPVTVKGKAYVLAYVVDAASFLSVFREQRLPDRWVATVLDNNNKIIARSMRHEKWVGSSATPDMINRITRAPEGVSRSTSLDGVPTVVAYSRSPQTGWTLLVAIPRADLAKTVTSSVVLTTGVFALLLVLGVGLALFFSRRINREVGGLVAAAHAIGQGQPITAPSDFSLEEIDAIHAALSDASRELQVREERQKVMINELNHRVKNTLATVQALARQTFGKMDGAPVERFTERLIALSAAHDLLTRGGWSKAELDELLRACTRAHGDRVVLTGPSVSLDPHYAVSLSMVFHELATNSAKYGALSVPTAQVTIDWKIDPATLALTLRWTETGGPPVTLPNTPGFGTRLIDISMQRELKGSAAFDFRPEGLVFEATVPQPPQDSLRWSNPF